MLSRPLLDRTAFLGISWYAILIVGAIVIGYFLANREAERLRQDDDLILDFLLRAIPLGIICARLYYVIFRFNHFSEDILSVLDIRSGGLAIYGGILGGLLAAKLTAKKHKIRVGMLLDIAAPALVLGQAIGRWGNYINMEAYGLRVADEALQFFPFAVEIPVGQVWYWQMATFFYEFCWDLVVFAALLLLRRKLRRTGDVFCWYLLLYCSGRTVIEGLRSDSLTFISDFVRISQVLSAFAALGVVICFFLRIRDRISPVTAIPVAGAVLSVVSTFLGEFERGAYGFLFKWSQALLIVLAAMQVLFVVLWTMDTGAFTPSVVLPMAVPLLCLIVLFLFGLGRVNEDNTYYVSLRQCGAMLQLVSWGSVLYFLLGRDMAGDRE